MLSGAPGENRLQTGSSDARKVFGGNLVCLKLLYLISTAVVPNANYPDKYTGRILGTGIIAHI